MKSSLKKDDMAPVNCDAARATLDEVWTPFGLQPRSKAAAVAAMLTSFCRPSLPDRAAIPIIIFRSDQTHVGTQAAQLAMLPLATADARTELFPSGKRRANKIFEWLTAQPTRCVVFVNVPSVRELKQIAKAKELFADKSAYVFVVAKGAVAPIGALFGHFVWVELSVGQINSPDRKSYDREKICAALETLTRAWHEAGRPAPPSVLTGYHDWSQTVPAIATCSGYQDLLDKSEYPGSADEKSEMERLVAALVKGRRTPMPIELSFADLTQTIIELGLFKGVGPYRRRDLLVTTQGPLTNAGWCYFGALFRRHNGQTFRFGSETALFNTRGHGRLRRFVIS
jgi:hypothetical protein